MTAIAVLGYALDCAGLGIAAYGLKTTWQEFKDPAEGFLDPVRKMLGALRGRFRRSQRALARSAANGVGTAHDARVQISPGPVPEDTEGAIRQLIARTDSLYANVNHVRAGLDNEVAQRREELASLRAEISTLSTDQAETLHRVSVGGIRWAAFGLGLSLVGTVLQAIG
jgi:hypothetical protein